MNQFPEGSKFGSYYITKLNSELRVFRHVTLPCGKRKTITLRKSETKHFKSKDKLEAFVERLNGRINRRKIEEIKTKIAFIPAEYLEEFRVLLLQEIPNQRDARNHYRNLHRYFLRYFVDYLNLKDPLEWKLNESGWGKALLNEITNDDKHLSLYTDNKKRAVKTIKRNIQVANRFMLFLNSKLPKEIPLIKFTPISKAKLKHYQADLNLKNNNIQIGKYIKDEHWEIIKNKLPNEIKPFVILGYYYGLRRSETLGLELNDLAIGHLNIKRQLRGLNLYEPLKGRSFRKTPHWFISPKETYQLIKEASENKMHPDTLSSKFIEFLKKINLTQYKLHDLRRTFITRALDYYKPKEVMLAVGHVNIEITMKYIRDDRDLLDEIYVPD